MTDAAKAVEAKQCGAMLRDARCSRVEGHSEAHFYQSAAARRDTGGSVTARLTAVEEPAKVTERPEIAIARECGITQEQADNFIGSLLIHGFSLEPTAAPGDVREGVEIPGLSVTEADKVAACVLFRKRCAGFQASDDEYIRKHFDQLHLWLSERISRERQLLAALQQVAELNRTVKQRTEWANCGGVPTNRICTFDLSDPHTIYGSHVGEQGKYICDAHHIHKLEAELSRLRGELKEREK